VDLAEELAEAVAGVFVLDVTSVPAHITILVAQEGLRIVTKEEDSIKEKIRPRLSVIKKKLSEGADAGDGGDGNDGDGDGDDSANGEDDKQIVDAKLSKIKIETSCITDIAGSGIVGTGVDDIIKTHGNTTSQELVDDQQKKYISAAATMEGEALYEKQRQYNEQEQAVQMIAFAATVRKNVNDTIGEIVDEVDAHFEASGDEKECKYGCVKRDLDPENKKDEVHKNADYNQSLREYAYYSLVYDQLLSLEQQIIGLRLQAKAALSEQKADVLSDVLEMEQ
ncbi:MAG: hypothetical protein SPL08_03745, partial [Pseudomonadota bacterium]|nr:hypothetical protein [Pseudomonadota bacterium]